MVLPVNVATCTVTGTFVNADGIDPGLGVGDVHPGPGPHPRRHGDPADHDRRHPDRRHPDRRRLLRRRCRPPTTTT